MPGEDPFHFASRRTPAFPVVMFDDTLSPYDAEAAMQLIDHHRIGWIVVKRRLQPLNPPWRHTPDLVDSRLPSRYSIVEEIGLYVILRRN